MGRFDRGLTIVSGGQTGADRAALDWALRRKVPHGGWCPKGRWAEDGVLAPKYRLQETALANPSQRTEWNVRDSDGTVIFSIARILSGGSRLTARFARAYQKPLLHLHAGSAAPASQLKRFIREHKIRVLNVAGPRASQAPAIERLVKTILGQSLGRQRRRNTSLSAGEASWPD